MTDRLAEEIKALAAPAESTGDALRFIDLVLRAKPTVNLDDEDGIISIEWWSATNRIGALLVFSGDGTASLSFKAPGRYYSEGGVELPVPPP